MSQEKREGNKIKWPKSVSNIIKKKLISAKQKESWKEKQTAKCDDQKVKSSFVHAPKTQTHHYH